MKAYYKILCFQDLENWQGKTASNYQQEETFSKVPLE